jgi:hypothetical protein
MNEIACMTRRETFRGNGEVNFQTKALKGVHGKKRR